MQSWSGLGLKLPRIRSTNARSAQLKNCGHEMSRGGTGRALCWMFKCFPTCCNSSPCCSRSVREETWKTKSWQFPGGPKSSKSLPTSTFFANFVIFIIFSDVVIFAIFVINHPSFGNVQCLDSLRFLCVLQTKVILLHSCSLQILPKKKGHEKWSAGKEATKHWGDSWMRGGSNL